MPYGKRSGSLFALTNSVRFSCRAVREANASTATETMLLSLRTHPAHTQTHERAQCHVRGINSVRSSPTNRSAFRCCASGTRKKVAGVVFPHCVLRTECGGRPLTRAAASPAGSPPQNRLQAPAPAHKPKTAPPHCQRLRPSTLANTARCTLVHASLQWGSPVHHVGVMCVHSPGRIVVILFEFNQNDSRFLANRTDGTRVRAFDKRSAGTRVEQTHGRGVSGVLQGHGGVHKRACGEAPCKEQSGLKAPLTDACGRKGRTMLTQTRDGNKFVEFAFALCVVHRPAAPFVPEGAKYGHGLRTPIQSAHTPRAHWWVNLVASSST